MDKEQLRMQMLAGVITEGEYKAKLEENDSTENKDSLNENFVGMSAINSPFLPREKESYEDAFEHFLNERYQIKPNREQDLEEDKDPDVYESEEMEEGEEVNEGFLSNFLSKLEQNTGILADVLTVVDIAKRDKEGGAEEAVKLMMDKHNLSEEEALKVVQNIYDKYKWLINR